MAAECEHTLVDRLLKPRPQINCIRSNFKEMIYVTKIGVYDNYNVFLDFTNDDDFNPTRYKCIIDIEGQQMWLQKWSPDFKEKEDFSIGTPLEMDLATIGRTRPSMAKVRVEIDLIKPQLDSVYVGLTHKNFPQTGFMQEKIEYEGVPKYCKYCKKKKNMGI
ncbi:hypothetical protein R3W88_014606 [Solanum pinnatisectum]|uniref:Uncharacterized protein n=1 Tax=Solanum pinnatisectum TaxID=50273 RepID=A0AAV9KSY4_9SOLN|nr:hypothetical protein R3W88_014606 [Solanum pinnatisectum]